MQYAKIPLSILRDSRLSKNDFRVLGYLIYRSNSEGKCWPSVQDISRQILLAESEVSRHTKRLQSLGLIHKKSTKGGAGNPTVYTIITPVDSTVVQGDITPVDSYIRTPVDSYIRTPILYKPITETKNKRTVSAKRISVFSIDEILSVKIPENLANEKSFISAWETWIKTKVNQKQKKNRWTDVSQVEKCLDNLSVWFDEGLDIVEGLETATDREWIGFRKQYFNLIANTRKPKLSKSEEIDKAFADFRKTNNADRIRNARDPQNTDGNVLEFSGRSVHGQSVGVGARRFLT